MIATGEPESANYLMNVIGLAHNAHGFRYIFTSDYLKQLMYSYANQDNNQPLILYGDYAVGKSTLAELIATAKKPHDLNRVKAQDLTSNTKVNVAFRPEKNMFRSIFEVGRKKHIVEECNFEHSAHQALRVLIDETSEHDLFIFTTNQLSSMDRGIRSLSLEIELFPLLPEQFLPKARQILLAEGMNVPDSELLKLLEAVYQQTKDNRRYFQKLDELLMRFRHQTR